MKVSGEMKAIAERQEQTLLMRKVDFHFKSTTARQVNLSHSSMQEKSSLHQFEQTRAVIVEQSDVFS